MNAVKIYEDAKWKLEHNEITLGEFKEMIKPLEDVRENIPGEWIKTNPLTDTFECSLCGMQIPVPEMCSPFCPLCGAVMRRTEDLADEINELIGEGFVI